MTAPLISAADVAFGRQVAEAHMIDTCTIRRYDAADRVWDEDEGRHVRGPGTIVYQGKCRIQVRSDINSNAVEAVVGDHESTYRTSTFQLPIAGTERVVSDCEATIDTCPLDAHMVGRVLNLQADTKGKTHATHRRFRAREVLS